MIFKYEAVSNSGERIEGTFEGNSEHEVIAMLRSNHYLPIKVEADLEKSKSIEIFTAKVKKKDIALFCRQFFTMLDAGLGIVECIDILERQSENKTLRIALGDIKEEVQKGQSLSDSLKRHSKIFPELLIGMVEAGELSGNLDVIMERMSEHYEKEYKLDNKIKSSMIYPMILAIVTIAVVIFLLVKVLPTFVGMFEESGQELPGVTQFVMNVSNSMVDYWYIYTIILIGSVIGFNIFRSTHDGRRRLDGLKLKLPVLKDTNVKMATSKFTRTLSTLISSGISLIEALDMVSKVVGNTVVEDRLVLASEEVQKGIALSKATDDVKIFPPMVISMIKIGEESGTIDDILSKTADFYDEELQTALDKMTAMIEPIMIVFMAIVVGIIVVAMVIPMFDSINMLA